ncbi:hypothetical protein SBA5_760002 [Candidatus Sulfotelmatomonas gaucii]|uniref:Uncharacterized protein n=1 Tax=Candidatus Sulfuritelmatomonas gaucii TaxID=2043161 RepID=A0A2N9M3Z4_9BACT|nr:hypothetical protein SBA5_760002 [Candidatus Sulfotelmatomonas gaucii]
MHCGKAATTQEGCEHALDSAELVILIDLLRCEPGVSSSDTGLNDIFATIVSHLSTAWLIPNNTQSATAVRYLRGRSSRCKAGRKVSYPEYPICTPARPATTVGRSLMQLTRRGAPSH